MLAGKLPLHALVKSGNDALTNDTPVQRKLDSTGPKNSNCVHHMRKTFYIFSLACLVYTMSWTPILCRIFRGVVRYPDEMPVAIWVTTIGILIFYETFIIAQCSSMFSRLKFIFESNSDVGGSATSEDKSQLYMFAEDKFCRMDRRITYFLATVSLSDWLSIALVSMGTFADLISAILLTIPSIRENIGGGPDERQKQEVWLLTAYLFTTWTVVVITTTMIEKRSSKSFLHTIESENSHKGVILPVLVYLGIGVGMFFIWASLIIPNMKSISYTASILLTILSVIALFVATYMGAEQRLKYLPKKRAASTQGTDDTDGNAGNTVDHDTEEIKWHANLHGAAFIFHLALVAMAFTLGQANSDIDWGNDYLLYHRGVHLMTGDWKPIVDAKNQLDDLKELYTLGGSQNSTLALEISALEAAIPTVSGTSSYRIDYCATDSAINIYFIILSMFWSACSCLQHYISMERLLASLAPDKRPSRDKYNDQIMSQHQREIGYCGVFIVFGILFPLALWSWNFWILAIMLIFGGLACVVVWIKISGVPCVFSPLGNMDRKLLALYDTRAYKWIEYSFSATAMHVVVLQIAGILSAHEITLSAAMLAFSLMLVQLVDAELTEAEIGCQTSNAILPEKTRQIMRFPSRIGVKATCDTEKPFLFLSFFAKGILSVALTVPFVFANNAKYTLQPAACQVV